MLALVVLSGCGPDSPAAERATDRTKTPSASPRASSAKASPKPLAHSAPDRLRIPAIGVDTGVIRLGLTETREIEVPPIRADDPAGWYEQSPTPGELGPSVILGHVTVGKYGAGVFKRLPGLDRGDRITITRKDGSAAVFAVDSVERVAKKRFPTQRVYGNTDHAALRLITCGGSRSGGEYSDNVIAYASQVTAR
ncbi:class F sortase [Streptomyces coryli]|uniref:class F sortase n=1 Tax=Streptomyces coryli TaxID=1128680 RepID=UPI0030B8C695